VTNEAKRNEDTAEPLFWPFPVDKKLPLRTVDCMPAYEAIPKEFKSQSNQWVRWQNEWFFHGLKAAPDPLDGIDGKAAMRHLNYIQRSWDTEHEHKECAVAYLASLWFRGPNKEASDASRT